MLKIELSEITSFFYNNFSISGGGRRNVPGVPPPGHATGRINSLFMKRLISQTLRKDVMRVDKGGRKTKGKIQNSETKWNVHYLSYNAIRVGSENSRTSLTAIRVVLRKQPVNLDIK